MKTKTLAFLLVAISCAFAPLHARAAESVFSGDGTHVFIIDWEDLFEHPAPKLIDIDIEAQARTPLNLGRSLGAKTLILDLSAAPGGKIAVLTAKQIWLFDPSTKACAKFFAAPKGESFIQIACNPKDGSYFVDYKRDKPGSDENLWDAIWVSPDGKKTMPVVLRRLDAMSSPIFDSAGNLFFGSVGDLWEGKLVPPDADDQYKAMDLQAHRCAPLATLETQNTTPDEMGVQHVAPAQDWIYAHVYRMGGSGWGKIVRLKVGESSNSGEDLEGRLEVYADAIRSVQVLQDNGSSSWLCASRDGKRVFYTAGNDLDTAMLVENGGKSQPVFPQKKAPEKQ